MALPLDRHRNNGQGCALSACAPPPTVIPFPDRADLTLLFELAKPGSYRLPKRKRGTRSPPAELLSQGVRQATSSGSFLASFPSK
jgi:hypothetical protein